jgi:ketosteroid isomerase-like protein
MKKQMNLVAVVTITAMLCWSCQPATSPAENVEAQLRSNWDAFINHWHNEDATACAAFYAKDGINVPAGFDASVGREAIEGFYRFLFDNNISSNYSHNTKYVAASGSVAVEYAEFSVDWLSNDSTEWTYQARVLAHWEKNMEGEWKIKAFVFNSPPASTEE